MELKGFSWNPFKDPWESPHPILRSTALWNSRKWFKKHNFYSTSQSKKHFIQLMVQKTKIFILQHKPPLQHILCNTLFPSLSTRWGHSSWSTCRPAGVPRLHPPSDRQPQTCQVVQTARCARSCGDAGLPTHVAPTHTHTFPNYKLLVVGVMLL